MICSTTELPWHLLYPELLNNAIISMLIFCFLLYWQLCKCGNSILFISTSLAVPSSMLIYKMHIIIDMFLSKFWSRIRKTVEEFLASETVALPRSDVTGSWRAIIYTICIYTICSLGQASWQWMKICIGGKEGWSRAPPSTWMRYCTGEASRCKIIWVPEDLGTSSGPGVLQGR